MPLKEEFERVGNKLFRWRSYLPVLILPLIIIPLLSPEIETPLDDIWDGLCLLISLTGITLRILTVGCAPGGTSGRNTRKQKAAELNTSGIYSIVRHPIYFGNFLIWLGMSMFSKSAWCILVSLLIFWLYYERIMFAEEEFLRQKFGDKYLKWAEKMPAFIPRFRHWQPPSLKFSIKSSLSREHTTFFIISFYFVFMDSFEDIAQDSVFGIDAFWAVLLIMATFVYISTRFLRKKTNLLKEDNR
ncbi:MAG TPA: DUF1295 domain-containing protein [Nitrospirae bacterium]|nr:isoprenylcysteine carboxyl methyltransferase (ICMT) family protein [bacterium BMS3Abin06]GBE37428.1 isoprenylcysteine carboxyl methyltransferase (ICMT) family protein [bacterium BMS3Bbin08]HDH11317.1 DUF1295 domain-containing protein [Nitrospirota bacterium]HDZ00518.1 DUF1295 domain-containing protein [Nitrospirota bacterium]